MFINVLCEVYEEYLEGYILLNMGSILLLQSEYSQRVFRSYITSSDMGWGGVSKRWGQGSEKAPKG